jgi:hypothetical protein
MEWQNQDPQPKRWGRVVDVVSDGILYMEDAERLKLNGVVFPADFKKRNKLEALLMDLVSDKIIYYIVLDTDRMGRLNVNAWIDEISINDSIQNAE